MDRWTKGYSQEDLDRAQERYGLIFPPDLIALLRDRQPACGYDWSTESPAIRKMLQWPFDLLQFDVENGFWWPDWGERPDTAEARGEILREALARAPQLIPIYAHRFLPGTPCESGNPVFSMYGFDTIYYGSDLADYCEREFDGNRAADIRPRRHIAFWSDIVEGFDQAYAFYAQREENRAAIEALRDRLRGTPPEQGSPQP